MGWHMSFEQIWISVFFLVRDALFSVTSPFIFLARQVGLELNPAQVWMLFFTLLFVGYAAQLLYGDFVLSRRGRCATGTVVGIDPGDETPRPPVDRIPRSVWPGGGVQVISGR